MRENFVGRISRRRNPRGEGFVYERAAYLLTPPTGRALAVRPRIRRVGMPSVHKAFMNELAKLPRRLLIKLMEEKLSNQGITGRADLAATLADHVLGGGGNTFDWNDDALGSDQSSAIVISFTDEDSARLHELTNEVIERLPSIVQNTTRHMAARLLRRLKQNWPEQAAYEFAVLDGFRERLEARWGKGFDLLRMLLISCREMGNDSAVRLGKSKSRKPRVLRSVLIRLHARACQITAEIITLIENGFADGAMARWRTLYEVGVVATVLADAGEQLAQQYINHAVVESKFAMEEYERSQVSLGYKPVPLRERRRIERAFGAAVKAYGVDFAKPYGWAATYLKKKRVTFRDLEEAAQRSAMRSHYKMASYGVHADTSKSLFFRLGVADDDHSIIVAGPTNAGFTEPAQNAAFTLVQITMLLIADRMSHLDVLMMAQTLIMIRDEIPLVFLRAERKLKRDDLNFKSTQKM